MTLENFVPAGIFSLWDDAENLYLQIENWEDSYKHIPFLIATLDVPSTVMFVPIGTIQGISLVRVIFGDKKLKLCDPATNEYFHGDEYSELRSAKPFEELKADWTVIVTVPLVKPTKSLKIT